ncbi:MAG TPA: ECF transporter S component [Candidatus Bathyarchaeia archaeon]|nr:ECF transporter S component [Candidatus Bathyarchaeia archaeon]
MTVKQNPALTPLKLTAAIVFAAMVCVVTLSFTLSVPVTGGYFNLGETVIYVAALVFGPIVGALAGGVGAAIADIVVAPPFAPGTLIIKSIEGAVVGFLGKKLIAQTSKFSWRIYTTLLGIVIGLLLAATGAFYYSGNVDLYIGIPPPPAPSFTIFVPAEFWYILGGATGLLIIFASLKVEPQLGWTIFSTIIGGLAMVVGYFLYEQIVLGRIGAVFEIPVNIGQMLIGLIVAIPVARFVFRSFPQLKS